MVRRSLALMVACVIIVGCGKSSPTAPTATTQPPAPTPAPAPAPTPQPAPAPPALTFAPQTVSPVGAALAIFPASRGQEPGKIAVAVTAHNLSDVVTIFGTIRFDPNVLEYDGWGEGDWFKQGAGSPAIDWRFFPDLNPGEIKLAIQRTSAGLPGASGSGEIILFRFRPRAGVRSGTSTLRWDGPSLRGPQVTRELPLNNAYGGTITIQ